MLGGGWQPLPCPQLCPCPSCSPVTPSSWPRGLLNWSRVVPCHPPLSHSSLAGSAAERWEANKCETRAGKGGFKGFNQNPAGLGTSRAGVPC